MSINLDEKVGMSPYKYSGEGIDISLTKRDLLRTALPILEEIKSSKEYISWMTVMYHDDVLDYIHQLLKEK